MHFDYYYGSQADQFSFIRIPRIMLTNKAFEELSLLAKVLYGVLLDRMALSMKNGWFDSENRVFIIYQIGEIQDDLGFSKKKAMDYLSELEKFGLVEKKRRGHGLPNILYVKSFLSGVNFGQEADSIPDENERPDPKASGPRSIDFVTSDECNFSMRNTDSVTSDSANMYLGETETSISKYESMHSRSAETDTSKHGNMYSRSVETGTSNQEGMYYGSVKTVTSDRKPCSAAITGSGTGSLTTNDSRRSNSGIFVQNTLDSTYTGDNTCGSDRIRPENPALRSSVVLPASSSDHDLNPLDHDFKGSETLPEVPKSALLEVPKSTLLEVPKSTPLEVPKSTPQEVLFSGLLKNNTKLNKTKGSYIESNHIVSGKEQFSQGTVQSDAMRYDEKPISLAAEYRELICQNIEFDNLMASFPNDKELLEGITDLIVETVMSRSEEILVASNRLPAEIVKSKLLKLDYSHIRYVLECFRENTTKVRNIKKYLLASLFNAPTTIDGYFTAEVNHDMYGQSAAL